MIARISQIATRAARWGQNSQRNLHKVQWPGIRQVDRRPGFHRDATKPVCCESSCGSRLLLLWRKNGSRFCDSPVSFLGGEQRHHSHVGIASGIYGQCSGCRGDFVGIFYDRPAGRRAKFEIFELAAERFNVFDNSGLQRRRRLLLEIFDPFLSENRSTYTRLRSG